MIAKLLSMHKDMCISMSIKHITQPEGSRKKNILRMLNGLRKSQELGRLSLWYLQSEIAASESKKMLHTQHFKSCTVLGNSQEVKFL